MFEKEIRDELRRQFDSGVSQTRIAQNLGVSQQTVSRIIADRLKESTVDLLVRVFPNCRIFLNGVDTGVVGSIVTANQSGGTNTVSHALPPRGVYGKEFLNRKILEDDGLLTAEEKVKFLMFLNRIDG